MIAVFLFFNINQPLPVRTLFMQYIQGKFILFAEGTYLIKFNALQNTFIKKRGVA